MAVIANDRPSQDEIDAYAQIVAPVTPSPNGDGTPDLASIATRLEQIDSSLASLTQSLLALTRVPVPVPLGDPGASMSNQGEELGVVTPRPGGLTNGSGQSGTTSTGTGTPPAPALSKHQGPDPIAGTGYMTTDATLNQDGVLYATTTTRSVQDLKGFTGGVFAVVADRSGNVLARTGLRRFGVDGLWIPGTQSTRTDQWSENVGAPAAANGATLSIVHLWDPHNRLFTAIPAILNDVVTLIGIVEAFCKQEPIVCSAVAAALGLAAMA